MHLMLRRSHVQVCADADDLRIILHRITADAREEVDPQSLKKFALKYGETEYPKLYASVRMRMLYLLASSFDDCMQCLFRQPGRFLLSSLQPVLWEALLLQRAQVRAWFLRVRKCVTLTFVLCTFRIDAALVDLICFYWAFDIRYAAYFGAVAAVTHFVTVVGFGITDYGQKPYKPNGNIGVIRMFELLKI